VGSNLRSIPRSNERFYLFPFLSVKLQAWIGSDLPNRNF
jgi:hypothetical protein